MPDFWVNGIVSRRDNQPYIQLSNDKGMIGQFSMAQARQIAQDILVMASRCEADAMILKFFSSKEFPEGAGLGIMSDFRDYRAELDQEKIDHGTVDVRPLDCCIHCYRPAREHSPDGMCMTPDGLTSYEAPPPL